MEARPLTNEEAPLVATHLVPPSTNQAHNDRAQGCLFYRDEGHSRHNVMTSRQFDVMTFCQLLPLP